MDSLEQRLADLETRLTFIDDTVQALASADADQALRIVQLEQLVRQLRQELQSVRLGAASDARSEPPPPHY